MSRQVLALKSITASAPVGIFLGDALLELRRRPCRRGAAPAVRARDCGRRASGPSLRAVGLVANASSSGRHCRNRRCASSITSLGRGLQCLGDEFPRLAGAPCRRAQHEIGDKLLLAHESADRGCRPGPRPLSGRSRSSRPGSVQLDLAWRSSIRRSMAHALLSFDDEDRDTTPGALARGNGTRRRSRRDRKAWSDRPR